MQVLVEKLLRSCSDLKTIYLLLRPKDGQDAKERLQKLLEAKVINFLFSKTYIYMLLMKGKRIFCNLSYYSNKHRKSFVFIFH